MLALRNVPRGRRRFPRSTRSLALAAAALAGAAASTAHARVFVLPHVLEKSGTINAVADTFDTTIFATYTAGLAGTPVGVPGSATLTLSLYDAAGQLLRTGDGAVVADHLAIQLSDSARKQSIRIDDLITAKGTFPAGLVNAYAVLDVTGDEANVTLTSTLEKSGDAAGKRWTSQMTPGSHHALVEPPPPSPKRVFVLPHVLEKQGTINSTPFTFDTTIFANYTGAPGGTADVTITLTDKTGAPLVSGGGQAIQPVTVALGNNARKQSIRIDDLITAAGGFAPNQLVEGSAIVEVTGDYANVDVSGILASNGVDPVNAALAVQSAQLTPRVRIGSVPAAARTAVFAHVESRRQSSANPIDTAFDFTYSGAGGAAGGSVNVELSFIGPDGSPLVSGTGTAIGPVNLTLDANARKRTVVLDTLITAAGGYATPGVVASAIVKMTGDVENLTAAGLYTQGSTTPALVPLRPFDIGDPDSDDDGIPDTRKTFVLPHILEKSGRVSNTADTFDTSLFATYGRGLDGGPIPASSATLDLYLYDDAGQPMTGLNGNVAFPYHLDLDATHRSAGIALEDLFDAAGGFGAQSVKLGFGVIVVGGADPNAVALQGFVVNSHTSAFDLSVFGFDPQPITAAAVPEPAALGLLGAAATALLARRRRRAANA